MESALIPVGSITSVNVGGRVSSCAKISGLNKKPRLCGRGEFEMTVGERRCNSPNCWNVQRQLSFRSGRHLDHVADDGSRQGRTFSLIHFIVQCGQLGL